MENKSKVNGKRKIKIYPKCVSRSYGIVVVPEIRLSGRWVERMNFKVGQHIEITYEENIIFIEGVMIADNE